MTELEEIRQFIKSKAFQSLSENARKEMLEQEQRLKHEVLMSALQEHIAPLLEDSGEPVSFNLSYSKDNGLEFKKMLSALYPGTFRITEEGNNYRLTEL